MRKGSAVSKLTSDAVGEDTLHGSLVVGTQDVGKKLGLLGSSCCGVSGLKEVLSDVHSQEFHAAYPLYIVTVGGQWMVLWVSSPVVNRNLCCCLHNEKEVLTPLAQ